MLFFFLWIHCCKLSDPPLSQLSLSHELHWVAKIILHHDLVLAEPLELEASLAIGFFVYLEVTELASIHVRVLCVATLFATSGRVKSCALEHREGTIVLIVETSIEGEHVIVARYRY